MVPSFSEDVIPGLPRAVKSQGKTKSFQGQGKVSEYCIWSGKFGILPKLREIYIIWEILRFSLQLFNIQIAIFKIRDFALDEGKVREIFSFQCVAIQYSLAAWMFSRNRFGGIVDFIDSTYKMIVFYISCHFISAHFVHATHK